jgi:hypothetical protein
MFGKKTTSRYKLDRSRSAWKERQKFAAPPRDDAEEKDLLESPHGSEAENDEDTDRQLSSLDGDSDSSSGPQQNHSHRSFTPRKTRPVINEDDEDKESEKDSEDESEKEEPKSNWKQPASRAQKSKTTSRGRRVATSKTRDDVDDDDDDAFALDGNSSEEEFEEELPKPKRSSRQIKKKSVKAASLNKAPAKRLSRRAGAKASRQQAHLSDSSSREDEEEENDVPNQRGRRPKSVRKKNAGATTPHTRSARNTRSGSQQNRKNKAASYPLDSLAGLPSPKQSRSSAIKARNKVRDVSNIEEKGSDQDVDSDELVEEESDDEVKPAPKSTPKGRGTPGKRKAVASSDEEFQADSESEASGDLSLSDAMDDEDDEVANDSNASYHVDDEGGGNDNDYPSSENDKEVVNIDHEQVGTADESSGDEKMFSSPNKKTDGEKKEILPSPHKGIFENSNSSDSDEDGKTVTKQEESRFRLPPCPSELDAITSEELPLRHVCYISPDGQSRQCFKLETLRQIALQSAQLALRVTLDGSQTQNFLQPPHFRTAASDDLLDQIASRFGRDALDLNGAYYKDIEKRGKLKEDYSEENSDSDHDHDVYELYTLQNSMQRYLTNSMGHADLYVCPLCYNQAHWRLSKPESDDEEDTAATTEYEFDVMDVLGSLDRQEFEIAAQFCFTKVSDVKKHLRSAHNIDPRGVQGNDFYARYKIRTPDGLLQRWLAHRFRASRQGSMREYWNQGNNQCFILLLDLVKRARVDVEDVKPGDESSDVGSDSEEEKIKTSREKAEEFWDSFGADAHSLWKKLSEPFQKDQENMKSFITKDDDMEEGSEDEVANHAALHHEWASKAEESDENDFAHKLGRKYAKGEDGPDNSDESRGSSKEELEIVDERRNGDRSESDDEAEDEEEFVKKRGYYSPVEEETDDWMLRKMELKRRKSTHPSSHPPESASKRKAMVSATPVGKKLRRKSTLSASKMPVAKTPVAPIRPSATKRTPAIQDSDEEDD